MKIRVWDYNDERMYYDVAVLDSTASYFMKSTGIKDKNNREIYVKDIVKFGDYDKKQIGVIELTNEGFYVIDCGKFCCTQKNDKNTIHQLLDIDSMVIIGNTFENHKQKEML